MAGQLYRWGPLIVWKWKGEGNDWSVSQKVPALEELPWLLFSLSEFIGQVIWAVLLLGLSVAWVICCLEWNTPKLSGLKQHTQLYYVLWLGLAGWFFSQSSSGPLPCLQTDGTGGSRSLSRVCRQMGLEALGASPVFVDRWDWRLSGPLPSL